MSGIIGYQSDSGKSGLIGPKANFKVRGTGGGVNLTDGSYINHFFTVVDWSVGCVFNNTSSAVNGDTYCFIAPANGTYQFTWISAYTNIDSQVRLLCRFVHLDDGVNAQTPNYVDNDGPDHWVDSALGGTLAVSGGTSAKMRAGDTASVSTYFTGGSTVSLHEHSTFSGWWTGPVGR